jgi:hypothetical protein
MMGGGQQYSSNGSTTEERREIKTLHSSKSQEISHSKYKELQQNLNMIHPKN